MKNKGFTLIELLAVIIILAIIALIAIPIILHIIENVQLSSFKSSINGMENAIKIYQVDKEISTTFILENGRLVNELGDTLEFVGDLGEASGVKITKYGNVYSYMYKNGYCTLRRGNNNEIEQFKTDKELCNIDVATNLVKNGYGEYKNNTNFSSFTYEDGSFKFESSEYNRLLSKEYIKVDISKKYYISATIKSNNNNAVYYSGLAQYDIDKKSIEQEYVYSVQDTLTYLTKDLKDGDTIIYLNDISNFKSGQFTNTYQSGLIFWNYTDSTGYAYPELTYSRNAWRNLFEANGIDKLNNTITLLSPWNHGTFKTGTKVSQSNTAVGYGTYNYGIFYDEKFSYNEWVTGEVEVKGTDSFALSTENDKFRNGTSYIHWLTLNNYNSQPDVTTYYKDIIIREVD